jgi:hypothetical protein
MTDPLQRPGSSSTPNARPPVPVHLRRSGVSVVVGFAGAMPAVLHWGCDLGALTDEELLAFEAASVAPVPHSAPDTPRGVGMIPLPSESWSGTPGLVGRAVGGPPGASASPRPSCSMVEGRGPGGRHRGRDGDPDRCDGRPGARAPAGADTAGSSTTPADRDAGPGGGLRVRAARAAHPAAPAGVGDRTPRLRRALDPRAQPAAGPDPRGHLAPGLAPRSPRARFADAARRGHARIRLPRGAGVGGARRVERQPRPPRRAAPGGRGRRRGGGPRRRRAAAARRGAPLAPGESLREPVDVLRLRRNGLDGMAHGCTAGCGPAQHHPARPRPLVLNTWEAVYFDHDRTGSPGSPSAPRSGRCRALRPRRRLVRRPPRRHGASGTGRRRTRCGRRAAPARRPRHAAWAWSSASGSSPRWSTPTPTSPAPTRTGCCDRPAPPGPGAASRCSTSRTRRPTPTSSSGSTRCSPSTTSPTSSGTTTATCSTPQPHGGPAGRVHAQTLAVYALLDELRAAAPRPRDRVVLVRAAPASTSASSSAPTGSGMSDCNDALERQAHPAVVRPSWSPRRSPRSRRSWRAGSRPRRRRASPWCRRRRRAWSPR